MKLWETFLFEWAYQARRLSTWIYAAVLAFFAFAQVVGGGLPGARSGGYFLDAPFVIARVTAFCTLIWLLLASFVAGSAAARDAETRMDPLSYTTPVGKSAYLGGRFFAAFVLNAVILLAVPVGIWLGLYAPEVEAEVRGPFRPLAYFTAYGLIALPTALVGTAVHFAFATLGRRAVASYVGAVLLVGGTFAGIGAAGLFFSWDIAPWLDPIGVLGMSADDATSEWTLRELNTRLTWLNTTVLANRFLWTGVAFAVLAFTSARFRFRHPESKAWRRRLGRRRDGEALTLLSRGLLGGSAEDVPEVQRAFDLRARAGQMLAIAWEAFARVVKTRTSLLLLSVVALFAFAGIADPEVTGVPGVSLVPRTDYVLFGLWNPGFPPGYLILPVLIVYWSGELVWREREAGLSEMVDAAPVPDWLLLPGKLVAMGLLLAVCIAIRMAVGISVQVAAGYWKVELGQYAQLLFGLQLTDALLLGLLAVVVQAVLNQRHLGHLLAIVVLVVAIAGPQFGIDDLLAYGFDLGWSYTAMRGFGPSLEPWLWYKLYWTAWAVLLGLVTTLFWVRGVEEGFRSRLRIALRRLTPMTASAAAVVLALTLAQGGFIFYNTHVLTAGESADSRNERAAEYERRYGQLASAPQPRLTRTSLDVEIDPERRRVEIHGAYFLANDDGVPIDSIYLAPASGVEPSGVQLDRSATLLVEDEKVGHRTYQLDEALQPGDSLRLDFEVRYEPRGFPDSPVDSSVVANGTYLYSQEWLPAVGYQRGREIRDVAVRKALGLPARAAIPSLDDMEARRYVSWAGERIDFEAVVATAPDQVAIAPGVLRETWIEGGRRHFRYSTDAPIGNDYAIASADYARHEVVWNDVAIEILHDPRHTAHLNRTVESVRAALDHYSEQFGPYPYGTLRFVERAGPGFGLHAEAGTITYREWFTLMSPEGEQGLADVPFAVVAHEVGHQWWGAQLGYAFVEGAGVLSESLAWYSAIGVVEETLGREEMRRLLRWMRRPYPAKPENVPLLRATGDYHLYRKGPFAMFALRESIGADRVNFALRHLLEEHRSGKPPLPTTLDLYRELQAVTPEESRALLQDLFEVNTLWGLETKRATAEETDAGTWQVTLEIEARKVVVDGDGNETEMPMDDWIEVGVFAAAEEVEGLGEPLYLERHGILETTQTITVTVPREPALAGIDPRHLLDWGREDNVVEVEIEG